MERNLRKTRLGTVVSDKMDKTIVVEVVRKVKHPLYKKYIKTTKVQGARRGKHLPRRRFVEIQETRPLSKDKCWRLVE